MVHPNGYTRYVEKIAASVSEVFKEWYIKYATTILFETSRDIQFQTSIWKQLPKSDIEYHILPGFLL